MKLVALFTQIALGALLLMNVGSATADGFSADQYVVTKGDFDGDGDTDLFIREKPEILLLHVDGTIPITLPEHMDPFVLLQGPNKTFVIDSYLVGLNLSSAQASSVNLNVLDVNLDGFTDAVLTNVDSAVSGAKGQIVYANSIPGNHNSPVQVRVMTNALNSFTEDVVGYFDDPKYFENTAYDNGWYQETYGAWYTTYWPADYLRFYGFADAGGRYVGATEDVLNPAVPPARCGEFSCSFTNGLWHMYVLAQAIDIEFDYSHFSQDAITFLQKFAPSYKSRTLVEGSTNVVAAANILEGVLGIQVLNNALVNPAIFEDFELGLPESEISDRRLEGIELMISRLFEFGHGTGGYSEDPFVVLDGINAKVKKIEEQDFGPIGVVKAIVLHRTGGANLSFGEAYRTGEGTHFWIEKDGTIWQTVSLDRKAAHVGVLKSKCIEQPTSCTPQELGAAQARVVPNDPMVLHRFEKAKPFPKRYPHNIDSIGIEVVGAYNEQTGLFEAATAKQLEALEELISALQDEFDLTDADVYLHGAIGAVKKASEGAGLGYP